MSPLREGDRIGPLRVVETPGHTIGSICLYEPEESFFSLATRSSLMASAAMICRRAIERRSRAQ